MRISSKDHKYDLNTAKQDEDDNNDDNKRIIMM